MKNSFSFALTAAAALFITSAAAAGERTSEGCFSSHTGLTLNATLSFNSKGSCGDNCYALGTAVFGTTNSTCWCGDQLPPASMKAADSACTTTCPGYPADLCGGTNLWSLYLTGLTTTVTNADATSSDTTSAAKSSTTAATTTSAKPSVVTVVNSGQTVVVTATPAASTNTSSSSSSSSSPSKTGIAVGVVVGLIAIAAIAGGAFLFIRNRKRREVEEEYRRNAAVSSFIAGGKAPGSSGGNSFADTRLEPAIMASRRMSDGSIMDNQDYSRRILKVTNA